MIYMSTKVFTINFDKLFNNVSKLADLKEEEVSLKEKKYLDIIQHIENAEVAGDVNWDSFTQEELSEVFDYIDEKESLMNEHAELMVKISKQFTKKASTLLIDIF